MKAIVAPLGLAVMIGLASAHGAEPPAKIKVGLLLTLSTPIAANGQQARNGFELALKHLGGKLGGREVETIVVDDEGKADVAVTKVKGLTGRDNVDFLVGPNLSSVLGAIVKPVTDTKTVLLSPNAGSSLLAGKGCNPYFFATSFQTDQVNQVSGKVVQERGYKSAYLIAPNYQAGKDALAGFKLDFRGAVAEESYMPLNTLDFQSELAKIASMKPDVVYAFLPGGSGVSFVKQYTQAGLGARIPLFSAFTVDESNLPAQGDAALGMLAGANWAPDIDNPQSRTFVADYIAAYNAVPATFAMQGYDAALVLDATVKALRGDLSNKEAIPAAMRTASFTSLRGAFKFNRNGFPIQDFYLTKVAKRPDGRLETRIVERIFSEYPDRYVAECKP